MIYILDTNTVSDFLKKHPTVTTSIRQALLREDRLILPQPVHYELIRGLIRNNAIAQLNRLNTQIVPLLEWGVIADDDWLQAAAFWADAVQRGKQLCDVDLLLAALAQRLDATLVTSDDDFNALTVKRINWRIERPS